MFHTFTLISHDLMKFFLLYFQNNLIVNQINQIILTFKVVPLYTTAKYEYQIYEELLINSTIIPILKENF